jgi:hypothetical protein
MQSVAHSICGEKPDKGIISLKGRQAKIKVLSLRNYHFRL